MLTIPYHHQITSQCADPNTEAAARFDHFSSRHATYSKKGFGLAKEIRCISTSVMVEIGFSHGTMSAPQSLLISEIGYTYMYSDSKTFVETAIIGQLLIMLLPDRPSRR